MEAALRLAAQLEHSRRTVGRCTMQHMLHVTSLVPQSHQSSTPHAVIRRESPDFRGLPTSCERVALCAEGSAMRRRAVGTTCTGTGAATATTAPPRSPCSQQKHACQVGKNRKHKRKSARAVRSALAVSQRTWRGVLTLALNVKLGRICAIGCAR
eukprot:356778-Chlamydomonas_euryale.AAC.10